jgi:osmotically-inducible protein OsmY
VPTQAEKDRAAAVASKVDGVHEVKNLLQVVPTAKREYVERQDSEVKTAVESAFTANHRVHDSGDPSRVL